MHSSAKATVAAFGLTLLGCVSSESDTPALPTASAVIEMTWGDPDNPADTAGFGMHVTLLADGRLSCRYGFSGDYMGFSGTTTSTGQVTPDTMRWLERTFTDTQYLALPDEMPIGAPDPMHAMHQLTTSFGGSTKQIRLVSGEIAAEAENDRLMKSVDAVFNVCPTRPLTPIRD